MGGVTRRFPSLKFAFLEGGVGWAFSRKNNPLGSQINALFGSDIGHFDVANMSDVLHEAYELAEDGLINIENFRDFVVTNPVHFWGDANPDFFTGTIVEKEVAAMLAEGTHRIKVNGTAASQVAK